MATCKHTPLRLTVGYRCCRCRAGETSTAICSIAYAAIAAAANIPGRKALLVAMIIFNLISTIVTTRNPTGDYDKALRALRS